MTQRLVLSGCATATQGENYHVEEAVRRSSVTAVERALGRCSDEFPATIDHHAWSVPLCRNIRCHPLQGFQRRRETQERNVGLGQHIGLKQHHRIVPQYRPDEQPGNELERQFAVQHARFDGCGREPAAVLIEDLETRLWQTAAGFFFAGDNRAQHHTGVFAMKYLAIPLALLGGIAQAQAADINFGEVRTRYQVQNELTAQERLRPWDVDWRHTSLWQDGRSLRTEFAPRGCYIKRWVTTPSGTQLRELFIC